MSQAKKRHLYGRALAVGGMALMAACALAEPGKPGDAPSNASTSQVELAVGDTGMPVRPLDITSPPPEDLLPKPRILPSGGHLQCVPYARRLTGLPIFGNAATWWQSAYGLYRRDKRPEPGAVMVFRSSRRNPFGHLAVVNMVVDSRKILVDHANWLNNGRIHRVTPVVDVSRRNDWSAVRVWYTPGNRLGAHVFPVAGFIHPEKVPPGELFQTVVNANVRKKPSRTARRVTRLPKQTTVELLERVPGRPWFRVAQDGQEIGYVFAPLVEPLS